MYIAKQAILTKDHIPDSQSYVFYMDIRATGKGLRRVHPAGAGGVRGADTCAAASRVSIRREKRWSSKGRIRSSAPRWRSRPTSSCSPLRPWLRRARRQLAEKLHISYDTNGFYVESHPKLRPVETNTAGVYLAGAAQGPKDIPASVGQGSAAAAKVLSLLSKDMIESDPAIATGQHERLRGLPEVRQARALSRRSRKRTSGGKDGRQA